MTDSHYAEAAPHAARAGAQGGAPGGGDGVRPLPNGHRLAGFELDSVLGTGGFGIVYRAFDRTLQRAVAVKEYMPAMLASRAGDFTVALRAARYSQAFDAGRAAFLNEARLLAQFDHPGLVKVLHFWESHGTAYMVMPFYEGQTLEQLQKRGKPMSEAALLRMLAAVLGALDVLHRAQCFHRDISLDNILMLPNGNPVLLDFGAARKLIGDMVDETAMMLKPGYAPIEQYTDDPAFRQGPWTDIYALGALAHALMTGELPPAAVVRSIQDQYRPLAGRESTSGEHAGEHNGEHYGERLRAAIDHALALRIEDRPESVAAFAQALGLHEPTPGVFVPAGYDAPARTASHDGGVERVAALAGAAIAGDAADGAARAARDERAEAPDAAKHAAEKPLAGTPEVAVSGVATPDAGKPSDVAPDAQAPLTAAAVAAAVAGAQGDSASEKSSSRVAWRVIRIPVLVVLLVLAVGIPALRYAIRAPAGSTQTAANRSVPVAPAPRASHAATLALAAPAANPPAQPAAGGANTATQAQQQADATTPGSGPTPAAPAMATDTAVVEVQAGKDKPVNATDLAAAPQQAAPEPPAAAEPQVAQTPPRASLPPSVRIPAPMPPVRVHFQVLPWGEVYVDGVRRGVSPPFHSTSLTPGTHRIEIRNGSLTPYVRTVTLDPGSPPLEISYRFE
ncbi:serine/threonine protein kinase [Paraburkholderia silviterrae]|uniref:non-specific serine/threonine protein kinase n=1 Tax=Paraburkholderia silviterrae TaxID=2528715 RepID=A0A4V2ZYS9_9BURK|nr:serine/threonine-protein kinase [Paraburkholderia silviterrae]TDG21939.1 serine/threonine protein kinase [Paraburkholderia silviterrae]